MLHLPYPLINVLSKIDNLSKQEPLPFNLDYYTEVQDLQYLLPHLEAEQACLSLSTLASDPTVDPTSVLEHVRARATPATQKWAKLNEAMIQLIEDFGLVSFQPLAVEDKASMAALVRAIDRASGFVFGADARGVNEGGVWASAMQEGWGQMSVADVQERWIDRREEIDELERREWEEEAREAGAMAKGGVAIEGVEEGRVPTVQEVESMRTRSQGPEEVDEEDLEGMQEAFLKSQGKKA